MIRCGLALKYYVNTVAEDQICYHTVKFLNIYIISDCKGTIEFYFQCRLRESKRVHTEFDRETRVNMLTFIASVFWLQ